MKDKGEKILRLCAEIECLCEDGKMNDANNKILELLGVVVGNSKYSYDINKAVEMFMERSEGYRFKYEHNGALR